MQTASTVYQASTRSMERVARGTRPCAACLRAVNSRTSLAPVATALTGQGVAGPSRPPALQRPLLVRHFRACSPRRAARTNDASKAGAKHVDMEDFPPERIRNLSIIAHIDHGKSTLADRLLQMTGTVPASSNPQFLDKLKVERERGITVKAQTVSIIHRHTDGKEYLINLIDTPGHVDFSYEVSRSLGACEGALILVDCTQGIQAQTLSVFHVALEADLALIPVINKVDLPHASPAETSEQIASTLGLPEDGHLQISAKSGLGVDAVLDAIVDKLPPPRPFQTRDSKLRGLIFDTFYDHFRGVVSLVRIMSGSLRKGDKVRFLQAGKKYDILEVGIINPEEVPVDVLNEGQVGYLVCNMKNYDEAFIGDTVCLADKPVEPLPGFKPMKAMVYAGVFPMDSNDFTKLEEAIERLTLNDRSVSIQRESSTALSQGFRLGFLGTLHMDVFRQRLEDEYDSNVIVTAPTVPYKLTYRDGSVKYISNPTNFPEVADPKAKVVMVEEPMVNATIFVPNEYIGAMMELCAKYRGIQEEYKLMDGSNRAILRYKLPLSEIVTDFFSELKSSSSGFASFDYEEGEYAQSDLVKLNLLLNGRPVDALAMIVHRSAAVTVGRAWAKKLKDVLPRQQFEVAVQAAIGTKVIARETVSAFRKDVTAGLYGGHYERKLKHLNRQKEGKKQLKRLAGNIEIPQSAFFQVLSSRPKTYHTSARHRHPSGQRSMSTSALASEPTDMILDVIASELVNGQSEQAESFPPPRAIPPAKLDPDTRSQILSELYKQRDMRKLKWDMSAEERVILLDHARDIMEQMSPQELQSVLQPVLARRSKVGDGAHGVEDLEADLRRTEELLASSDPIDRLRSALARVSRSKRVATEVQSDAFSALIKQAFPVPPSDDSPHAALYRKCMNRALYGEAKAERFAKFDKLWEELQSIAGYRVDSFAVLARLIRDRDQPAQQRLDSLSGYLHDTREPKDAIVLVNYTLGSLVDKGDLSEAIAMADALIGGDSISPEDLDTGSVRVPAAIGHLRPNRQTYQTLLKTLATNGWFTPAVRVMQRSTEAGFAPRVPDYIALFNGFARFAAEPEARLSGALAEVMPSLSSDPLPIAPGVKIPSSPFWDILGDKIAVRPPAQRENPWTRQALEALWAPFLAVVPSEHANVAPSPYQAFRIAVAWAKVTGGDEEILRSVWVQMEHKFGGQRPELDQNGVDLDGGSAGESRPGGRKEAEVWLGWGDSNRTKRLRSALFYRPTDR